MPILQLPERQVVNDVSILNTNSLYSIQYIMSVDKIQKKIDSAREKIEKLNAELMKLQDELNVAMAAEFTS